MKTNCKDCEYEKYNEKAFPCVNCINNSNFETTCVRKNLYKRKVDKTMEYETTTNTNTVVNSLNTAVNNYPYCQYRLPCGYCEKLNRDCPKMYGSLGYLTNPVTATSSQ